MVATFYPNRTGDLQPIARSACFLVREAFFSAQKLVWTQITGFGRLRRSHVSISVFCILAYERSSTVVIRQSLPVSAFRHFADSHPKISPRSILNPFCCKSRPPPSSKSLVTCHDATGHCRLLLRSHLRSVAVLRIAAAF